MKLVLVEIEGGLEQQTGLEVPLVFGLQEGGRRLLSGVFHRPKGVILGLQYFRTSMTYPKTLRKWVGNK